LNPTVSQQRVLECLRATPGWLSRMAIVRATGLGREVAAEALHALRRAGLVERTFEDSGIWRWVQTSAPGGKGPV
jgi:DNA-binding IclR family transcriptional regulator